MIVMMMAITPSLNASSRFRPIRAAQGTTSYAKRKFREKKSPVMRNTSRGIELSNGGNMLGRVVFFLTIISLALVFIAKPHRSLNRLITPVSESPYR
jgi:hypothetical protein